MSHLRLLWILLIASMATAQSTEDLQKKIERLKQRKEKLEQELSEVTTELNAIESQARESRVQELLSSSQALVIPLVFEGPLYQEASIESTKIVPRLEKGSLLTVLGYADQTFVEALYGDTRGFIPEGFLDRSDPNVRVYLEELKRASSPSYRALTSSGASTSSPTNEKRTATQCQGTTRKGARCKRMTTDPSGYCYQHK